MNRVIRKAQPTAADVHVVDVPLTNISVAYIQAHTNFVATQAFPIVRVMKQSDRYYIFDKAAWFRDEAEVRGDAAESAGSGYTLSSDTYFSDVYAIHKDVGSQARGNADAALDLDRAATEFVTQRLLLRREIQWTTEAFSTAIWANSVTPGNLWSDYAASDPITDIETGKTTILQNTGMEVNTMVLGQQTWRYLKHHPDIVDRYKATTPASITTGMVGALLEIPNILVCKAVKNTAIEAASTSDPTMAFVQGKHALLAHVAPNPSLMTPSAGYTFAWNGGGGMSQDVTINSFFMQKLKADRIEGEMSFDFKVTGTDLGYLLDNAVA